MHYHCCKFNGDCWRTPLRFSLSLCSRRRWWCISNVLATWLRMTKSKKGFKSSRWAQLICLLLCRGLGVQHCLRIIATIGPGSTHLSFFFLEKKWLMEFSEPQSWMNVFVPSSQAEVTFCFWAPWEEVDHNSWCNWTPILLSSLVMVMQVKYAWSCIYHLKIHYPFVSNHGFNPRPQSRSYSTCA